MKRFVWGWLSVCVLATTANAHVLDQYLQTAQIALAPDSVRIELRLIPGKEVAARVFALMDTDGDGQLSSDEQQAYAQRVRQDLSLTINQQAVPLTLAEAVFPERSAMNEGLGAIRMTFTAAAKLTATTSQQINFRNDHLPEFSTYLVNALVPENDALKITGQQRDALQRGLSLSVQTTNERWHWKWMWLSGLLLLLLAVGVRLASRAARKLSLATTQNDQTARHDQV
jgi:hypothetical protein